MNLYKRIISLFLVFAICISSMVTVAFAVDERAVASGFTPADFSSAVSYGAAIDENFGFLSNAIGYLGTLREAMATGSCDGCTVNPDGRHNFLPVDVLTTSWAAALKGGEACICRYCGITYDDFYDQTYNQYVSSLQTDLGTSVVTEDGFRLYVPIGSGSKTCSLADEKFIKDIVGGWQGVTKFDTSSGGNMRVQMQTTRASITGIYTPGVDIISCPSFVEEARFNSQSSVKSVGQDISLSYQILWDSVVPAGTYVSLLVSLYWTVVPSVPLDSDVSVNTRPTSIVGDYGIIGDNGTIIKVDGNMIVDESTSTVFNPVTNVTNNYTDYAFDYSDRSYNLTLEDGSTIKVVYGNENITIQEGDTIYNIYYLIPDDSGSGGGSDSGDTPSGEDMSWWKQAWTNFTDKLFSILGNGGSSVNPDTAPTVPDDEETGEKGYSVIDLFVVLKDGTWAFITGIVTTAYDGFTGFVESVSSAGSFFTFYDEESEDGILFVPLEGGETIWD